MRSLAAIIVLISSTTASAGGLSFVDNTIRLEGIRTSRRSMKVRADSLVFVLSPGDIDDKTIRPTGHPEISQIRVTAYVNRTELKIRFASAAEKMLGRLKIAQEGKALTVSFGPAPVAAKPAPAVLVKEVAPAVAKEALPAKATPVAPKPLIAKPAAKPNVAAILSRPLAKSAKATAEKPAADQKTLAGGGTTQVSMTSLPPWMLGLIIVGGIAGIWFVRKRKRQGPKGLPVIDIVGSRALSTKHRLVVVKVEHETLLLGCTDKDVQLLRCIEQGTPAVANEAKQQRVKPLMNVAELEQAAAPQMRPQTAAPIIDDEKKESFVGRLASKLKEQQAQNDKMQQAREKLQAAAQAPASPAQRPVADLRGEADMATSNSAESWADEFLRARKARSTSQKNVGLGRELAL
jgi:flagellar biogenesis protein FliO